MANETEALLGAPITLCPACGAPLVVFATACRREVRCINTACGWTRSGSDYLAACGKGGAIGQIRKPKPCTEPARMHGAADGFGGEDYPSDRER